ncbi:acyltransferase [uncultured Mucilaginibacter sp.]|uniref:acyltransferase n=1 Tax=uncultured Mucilaginibacter sp. TaxID=797541 RepID=UPI0026112793|nr:acyltransferase [uncultured Mucilaginibacter sp.]
MKFSIGKGSSVHLGCQFTGVTCFSMGKNSVINQYCRIDNRGYISIGDDVSISPCVNLITADHDIYASNLMGRQKEIIIKEHLFIGSDAMVLPGVIMEEGSVLGAKSLLTKSTVAFGIYSKLPAKLRANRPNNLNYDSSYIRWFH